MRRYGPVLVRLAWTEDQEKPAEPDYGTPGQTGSLAQERAHIVFSWTRDQPKSCWKKHPLREIKECEPVIVEVEYREPANPCPPQDGFEGMVGLSEDKARQEIAAFDCPIGCEGRYAAIGYTRWFCQEGYAVVFVQAWRVCGVI